jgi:hypothetical protein
LPRVVLLFLVSLFPCAALAQFNTIPIYTSCSVEGNTATLDCVMSPATRNGDAIIVGVSYFGTSNAAVVTDSLGTTYTARLTDTTHTEKIAVLTAVAGSSGANTFHLAVTSGQFMNMSVVELTGTPCDVTTTDGSATSTFAGTPATITTPSITTAFNGDCIYGGAGNDNSAGWQGVQDADVGTWWQVGSTAGADSGSGFLRIGGAAGAGNTITADNGGTSGTLFNVAFKSNALAINSPAAAPDGDTTHTYAYTELATGGAGAYTWSISAGALPTGLSINSSTGAITGTPTVSNNYTATIQVQDAGAVHTATKVTTFAIATALNSIAFVQGTSVAAGHLGDNTLAFPSNVTAGNTLMVNMGAGADRAKIGFCTDSVGTAYKLLTLANMKPKATGGAVNNSLLTIMAGIAPSSGADTVSCAYTGYVVAVAEFSNANFIASDNTGFTTGVTATPATVTSNSLTTLVPNEVIFGNCDAFTATSLTTVNAAFTQVGNLVPAATGYRLVTTVTGYSMSCSYTSNTSGVWGFYLVGLRPSGGPVTPPFSGKHRGQIL